MINLTLSHLYNFFQKFKILILAFFLLVVLFLLLLIILLPKEGERPQPVSRFQFEEAENVITKPEKIIVNFQKDLPEESKVYQIEKRIFDQTLAADLARKLGIFSPARIFEEKLERHFFFIEGNTQLIVSQTTIVFKTAAATKAEKEGISFNPVGAVLKTQSFLQKIGLWDELYTLDESSTRYSRIGITHRVQEKDPSKAQIIDLSFSSEIEGYKLVGSDPKIPVLTASLTSSGNLISFNLTMLFQVKESSIYRLKSFPEAKKELEGGIGTLVRVQVEGENPLASSNYNVVSINLNDVEIAYFIPDDDKNLLQPILVFTGDAILSDGRRAEAAVYLQAVKGI